MREMKRRAFMGMAVAALPLTAAGQDEPATAVRVPAGQDRFGGRQGLGNSVVDFKVAAEDTGGAVLVVENTNRAKGGPARHRHFDQDELFYVLEGEYLVEVGQDRFALKAGDSLLAPRRVPHVWAFVGNAVGRLLITFTPAGRMEAFFREVAKAGAMPPQDPALWRAHGMELVGPPLPV
jgi:quercetin dioxygenase-like cupin family protein